MTKLDQVKKLQNITGCSLQNCCHAIDFASNHEGCTPIGFLKAITFSVATPSLTFEERVRKFSEETTILPQFDYNDYDVMK